MLDQSASTHAMIAVEDLDRAKEFYSGTLGLVPWDERAGSGIRYEMRGGTWFLVYQSRFAGTAQSTCMRFEVEDVHATVKELRERGVVFEEYDLPGIKTVDGIAEHPSGARGAWFKDPDGNVLQIGQYHS
ncbi:MAG TPA: VOC family protein [Jatrophihabitantaceae bacterium]|jgi:catechol 2,3-dioxygenase-like lactoylglutathione lyase family enzyme|nr:VOC family protein [Jatrophihabitantaceae bacterium]